MVEGRGLMCACVRRRQVCACGVCVCYMETGRTEQKKRAREARGCMWREGVCVRVCYEQTDTTERTFHCWRVGGKEERVCVRVYVTKRQTEGVCVCVCYEKTDITE